MLLILLPLPVLSSARLRRSRRHLHNVRVGSDKATTSARYIGVAGTLIERGIPALSLADQ